MGVGGGEVRGVGGDINNAAEAELSSNLRELSCGQRRRWHSSIWPHLLESLPDGRPSVTVKTRCGGKQKQKRCKKTTKKNKASVTTQYLALKTGIHMSLLVEML